MSALAVRIRIARIPGGKYTVEKIKVREDRGDTVDVFRVPIKEAREFPNKQEARAYGEKLGHDFVVRKYSEGIRYTIECKTRVEIPPEVLERFQVQ